MILALTDLHTGTADSCTEDALTRALPRQDFIVERLPGSAWIAIGFA